MTSTINAHRNLEDLSDEQIREALLEFGYSPGPVVSTTRRVYENKLKKLLETRNSGSTLRSGSPRKQQAPVNGSPSKQLADLSQFQDEEDDIELNGSNESSGDEAEDVEVENFPQTQHTEIRQRPLQRPEVYTGSRPFGDPFVASSGGGRFAAGGGCSDNVREGAFNRLNLGPSITSARTATPRDVYGKAHRKATTSKLPFWAKAILFVLIVIFLFFLIKHAAEVYKAPSGAIGGPSAPPPAPIPVSSFDDDDNEA